VGQEKSLDPRRQGGGVMKQIQAQPPQHTRQAIYCRSDLQTVELAILKLGGRNSWGSKPSGNTRSSAGETILKIDSLDVIGLGGDSLFNILEWETSPTPRTDSGKSVKTSHSTEGPTNERRRRQRTRVQWLGGSRGVRALDPAQALVSRCKDYFTQVARIVRRTRTWTRRDFKSRGRGTHRTVKESARHLRPLPKKFAGPQGAIRGFF